MEFEQQVLATIEASQLLAPGDSIVVAVSGGPDSMALLTVLRRLSSLRALGYSLCVAHLDHSLRGEESQADAAFVRAAAERLGLPLATASADVPAYAREHKLSVEDAARRERYRFLAAVAEERGVTKIATGHTADDQAETVLQRILRGTGLRGLRAIRPRRRAGADSELLIVRPLLRVGRTEVLEYLECQEIGYRTDSSNLDPDFTRNRIRTRLLPLLESEFNPGVGRALTDLAEIATEAYDFVQHSAREALTRVQVDRRPDTLRLSVPLLRKEHPGLRPVIIREAIRCLKGDLRQLSRRHCAEILSLALSAGTGKLFHAPAGLHALKDYDELRLSLEPEAAPRDGGVIELVTPGATRAEALRGAFRTEVLPGTRGLLDRFRQEKTRLQELLDLSALTLPLRARTRRNGDCFWPLGAPGPKKLSDFFIDEKVSRLERDATPLVLMGEQVIWAVGHRIDERVKLTEESTQVLKIEFVPDPA